jgi:hypothetical protein
LSNQAGWECDACRKAGLEKKRRCGWLEDDGMERVVWARGGVAVTRCPRSTVTAASEAMVEEFLVWKRVGAAAVGELSARQVEAFVVLENAMEQEKRNGERRTRNAV